MPKYLASGCVTPVQGLSDQHWLEWARHQDFVEKYASIDQRYFLGEIEQVETETLPIFNLKMPKTLAGLDRSVLDPRTSYDDPAEWEKRARHLGGLFVENFEKFTDTKSGKARLQPDYSLADPNREAR